MYIVILTLGVVTPVLALDNGLALTPPMGWLTWAGFECNTNCKKNPDGCISENLIKRTADLMVSEGFLEAGYNYIGIDDCWMEKNRTDDGKLQANKERFPSGMKALADYVHAKGLKFGLYEDYGNYTCQKYPGMQNHEQTDVDTLVGWEIDYIKLDGCYSSKKDKDEGYPEIGKMLNASGRPILYSCSWPAYDPHVDLNVVAKDCNLWRLYWDIDGSWKTLTSIMDWFGDHQDRLQPVAGPGHWNDPDMLVIGLPGVTEAQAQIQMAVWAVLAAPLLMSTDLATLTPTSKATLLNKEVIAVNQDPLGIQGLRVTIKKPIRVWTRELSQNNYAVAFVNYDQRVAATNKFSFEEMRVPEHNYLVKNLFNSTDDQTLTPQDDLDVTVDPGGVVFLKFIPK